MSNLHIQYVDIDFPMVLVSHIYFGKIDLKAIYYLQYMVNKSNITIGEKIKKRRNEISLTQDELARKADIPYTTLVKIETGKVRNPSVDTVKKIASALNITIDELIS